MATNPSTLSPVGESAAGVWLHNPATGEIAHFAPPKEGGRRIEADLWLRPGAALARAHIHDHLVERFQVRAGKVGLQIGDSKRTAGPGDGTVEVPAGTVHDWWNAGEGPAHVYVEVTATRTAPQGTAPRFVSMIETVWSLGALGRVNAAGVPDPLWLVAIAREYSDVIRFVRPPAAIQVTLFGPLAAVARRTGRDPGARDLHGPSGACVIPDPGEDGLAMLLAQSVSARRTRRAPRSRGL